MMFCGILMLPCPCVCACACVGVCCGCVCVVLCFTSCFVLCGLCVRVACVWLVFFFFCAPLPVRARYMCRAGGLCWRGVFRFHVAAQGQWQAAQQSCQLAARNDQEDGMARADVEGRFMACLDKGATGVLARLPKLEKRVADKFAAFL